MKRVFSLLFIILLIFSFSSCKRQESEKIKIVTTVFPQYDFAKNIVGDKGEVTMLIRPSGESHTYDPTIEDIIAVNECDIFLYIGLEGEDWAKRILESKENENRIDIPLYQSVDLLCSDNEDEDDRHHHSHSHEYDEHIWTSPIESIKMCQTILDTLISLDRENEEYYRTNFENYKEKLLLLDERLSSLPKNKPIVFGDRFPFRYLFNQYGLSYLSAFPSCAEETEVDVKTLANLIKEIKENNVKAVFYTEFSNRKIADVLCEETGAVPLMLHSCHNVSAQDFYGGEGYVSLMNKNIDNLEIALK